MTDLKSSAKLARQFLETVSEGIGRLEGGASEFARVGASKLRHLPARFGGHGSSNTLRALVIAGVVASTAALIYAGVRQSRARSRRGWRSRY